MEYNIEVNFVILRNFINIKENHPLLNDTGRWTSAIAKNGVRKKSLTGSKARENDRAEEENEDDERVLNRGTKNARNLKLAGRKRWRAKYDKPKALDVQSKTPFGF